LRRRILNIYKETKNTVRIGKEESKVLYIWTGKGVWQGHPPFHKPDIVHILFIYYGVHILWRKKFIRREREEEE